MKGEENFYEGLTSYSLLLVAKGDDAVASYLVCDSMGDEVISFPEASFHFKPDTVSAGYDSIPFPDALIAEPEDTFSEPEDTTSPTTDILSNSAIMSSPSEIDSVPKYIEPVGSEIASSPKYFASSFSEIASKVSEINP